MLYMSVYSRRLCTAPYMHQRTRFERARRFSHPKTASKHLLRWMGRELHICASQEGAMQSGSNAACRHMHDFNMLCRVMPQDIAAMALVCCGFSQTLLPLWANTHLRTQYER